MNRAKLDYLVDVFMAISFMVTAVAGLVLFLFLRGGIQRGGQLEFLGIMKYTWSTVHEWAGIIMLILIMIHLLLHLHWITGMTRKVFSCILRKNIKK